MELKIFCPLWGQEHLEITQFVRKAKEAGYDGVDAWVPEEPIERKRFLDALGEHELLLIAHQHQAQGADFAAFKASFLRYLHLSAEGEPLAINSHTGRDYFTFEQNLELIDIAADFSAKTGLPVMHETHRGRFAYSPATIGAYFDARPELTITADFSHWVCVSESFLENFSAPLDEAILRTRHIHARIGYEEGPQVPDPRAPEWKYAADHFLGWWDRVAEALAKAWGAGTTATGGAPAKGAAPGLMVGNSPVLTFTTEFGPAPYMPTVPFSKRPVADQFEVNCYMKDVLRQRYGAR